MSNFNNEIWGSKHSSEVPDVVLVKKVYPGRRKARNRNWKLRRMAKEYNEDESRATVADQNKLEHDYEMFLQELEEDQELRSTVNLYKKPNSQTNEPKTRSNVHMDGTEMEDSDADDEGLTIAVDELLDDLEGMTLEDQY